MKDETPLISRLIGEAVIASWIGDRGIADVSGFDFRVAEKHFLAALRAHGMEVVVVDLKFMKPTVSESGKPPYALTAP